MCPEFRQSCQLFNVNLCLCLTFLSSLSFPRPDSDGQTSLNVAPPLHRAQEQGDAGLAIVSHEPPSAPIHGLITKTPLERLASRGITSWSTRAQASDTQETPTSLAQGLGSESSECGILGTLTGGADGSPPELFARPWPSPSFVPLSRGHRSLRRILGCRNLGGEIAEKIKRELHEESF